MNEFTMVIPSYWGRGEGEIAFDHPTALDCEGTLGRLLASLDIFGHFPGTVVVIAVADEPGDEKLVEEVERKVSRIIADYGERHDIRILGQSALEKIKNSLARKGVCPAALEMVNLNSYAAVRNVCSLAGVLEGSRYTIFIDDDEVFTDSAFLVKVHENMGRSCKGVEIEALAGYYLQPDTYRLDETGVPGWRAPFWNNAAAMNEAFDQYIGRGERLKPVPFVFGGNMTLSAGVLEKIPFDPRITRGEDIDFLLNLRINGITFYLDRELSIQHLPPGSDQPAWKKLREDTVRFLYERKKAADHPEELPLDELQPYPGLFLGDDLEERITKTAGLLKEEYESQGDDQGAAQCESIIALALDNPYATVDTRAWLNEIKLRWQEVTRAAAGQRIP